MATWKVEIDGRTFYEHDLSFADAKWVCEQVGQKSWRAIHPLLGGPDHAAAVFAAFVARADGISREEALARVDAMSIATVNSFAAADEDDRPKMHDGAGLPADPTAAETPTG